MVVRYWNGWRYTAGIDGSRLLEMVVDHLRKRPGSIPGSTPPFLLLVSFGRVVGVMLSLVYSPDLREPGSFVTRFLTAAPKYAAVY